jgi:cullin 3
MITRFIARISTVYPVMKSKLSSMCNEFEQEGEKFEKHSVNVLTGSKWPREPNGCVMDYEISTYIQNYKNEYEKVHPNRKLLWQYQFGTATIKLHKFEKPYEITCSTYQMAILLLFNGLKSDILTFRL